jgi:hypothetical protein
MPSGCTRKVDIVWNVNDGRVCRSGVRGKSIETVKWMCVGDADAAHLR